MADAPPAVGIPASREVLLQATKEQLVDLLLLALEGQKAATENMQKMSQALTELAARSKELEDKLASQEAELIVLRNRP